MIEVLTEMLSYAFLSRAIIVGLLAALCASLLGVSLVLKHYSMIGDGLSHVGFGALAVASVTGIAPLAFSLPAVLIAAFLLLRINSNSKINGDSAIALISTGALAVGVFVISVSEGTNTDIHSYLFGSILALSEGEATASIALSIVTLALYMLFYNRIFLITFDETFARASDGRAGAYNTLIAALTAVVIVLGIRIMGSMLISGLFIFPPLTSMRLFRTFKSVTLCSAVVSGVCFIAGITVSFLYATPTGASVIIANVLAFALFSVAGAIRSRVKA